MLVVLGKKIEPLTTYVGQKNKQYMKDERINTSTDNELKKKQKQRDNAKRNQVTRTKSIVILQR